VEADAAIAVPVVSEPHRGEDEWKRRRGEHVVDRQPGPRASAERPLPVADLAALHPGHGLTGRVVDGGEGDRFQEAPLELLGDADDLTVGGHEASFE